MRKLIRRSLVAAMLLMLVAPAWAAPTAIDARAANELIQKNQAVLVDVREAGEVAQGMAAPAQWLPLSKIEADASALKEFLARQPKSATLIFYCGSGRRAGKVATLAEAAGYKSVNMGGFKDWVSAGLPTRRP